LEERDTILEYIFNRYGRDRVAFVAPMWNSNTARYSEWVSFWFTQRRTRCAGKPIQLHDTNSVVALVQKYGMMLENIKSTQYAFLRNITEEPLQIIPF
jgi:DNA polymerase-3 subunit alpha/error-prone DNA polymerase